MAYTVTFINWVTAFLFVVLGVVVGNIASNVLKRFVKGLSMQHTLVQNKSRWAFLLEEYLAGAVKYFFIIAGFIYALNQAGVSARIIGIVFAVIIGLIILFVLLTVKDYIPNMIAGFTLRKAQKVRVGDHLTVKNVSGKVMQIGFLETRMQVNEEIFFIPNTLVLQQSEGAKKEH